MNLTSALSLLPNDMLWDKWREELEAIFAANEAAITYNPALIELEEVVLQSGVSALVAFSPHRPEQRAGEDRVGGSLLYKNTEYLVKVRARPYTNRHVVIVCPNLRQEHLASEQVELLLILARIYNSKYEILYNGVAPTWTTLHFQCLERRTTIFGHADGLWPARFYLLKGEDIVRLSEIVMNILAAEQLDILVRFDVSLWRVAAIPRRLGLARPQNELGDSQHFGTFGALEMGGFFVATRDANAFRRVTDNPGLYRKALENLSAR